MTYPAPLDLDGAIALADAVAASAASDSAPLDAAKQLLGAGEVVLESWVEAAGNVPTEEEVEGYRLLALHRQGAKGNPSFNACRETCRELVYLRNVVEMSLSEGDLAQARHHLMLEAHVLRHLGLFVGGKLHESGLGDFCCSSRPLHSADSTITN